MVSNANAYVSAHLGNCVVRDEVQGLQCVEGPEQVPLHFLLSQFFLFWLLTLRRNCGLDFQQTGSFCSFLGD